MQLILKVYHGQTIDYTLWYSGRHNPRSTGSPSPHIDVSSKCSETGGLVVVHAMDKKMKNIYSERQPLFRLSVVHTNYNMARIHFERTTWDEKKVSVAIDADSSTTVTCLICGQAVLYSTEHMRCSTIKRRWSKLHAIFKWTWPVKNKKTKHIRLIVKRNATVDFQPKHREGSQTSVES